jgi:hypothetical protein
MKKESRERSQARKGSVGGSIESWRGAQREEILIDVEVV